MGRQVYFWMLEQDTQEFVDFVTSEPTVVKIATLSSDPQLCVITNLPDPSERWWWSMYFWNARFPMEPRYVQVREGPDKGQFAFSPRIQDPVIEFTRSVWRESGNLSRGRIWTGSQDKLFLKWYDHIAGWIRRHYKKARMLGQSWIYAGPFAWEWYQGGGVLDD